jgi:gliding motility-associated-like protein
MGTYATHLYGGEMYYTYLSGNKYKVTMVLYGDCGASSGVFSALYTATPVVQVFNGTTLFRNMSLNVEAGAGTEVTPVCPLSLDSTTCHGGSIPGVRRFSYSDTITLLPSTSWRLRSTGSLGSTSSGRSSSITNIISPGSSIMSLEATLNNNTQPNSNPTFTTIPTPFFCINVSQEYNIGAVDSNLTDSLVYSMVSGLDGTSSTVTYGSGYSATAPLACATGSFSFSTSSGQLTFKPNLSQTSLVVYKVSEYRGGVLVGTSMREMNFIVLSTCSNRSPYGKISGVTGGGTAISNTAVNICKNDTFLSFYINPVDSDGNNITVSVSGLPAGSTMTITGNGTTSPSCAFSWNTSSVLAGAYYFYLTFQDNACPLSSKQTVGYTINILPKPSFTISTVSLTTCTKKAVFDIIPSGIDTPWSVGIYNAGTLIKSYTGKTGTIRDSLAVGTYTFRLTNKNGCFKDTTYTISPPPVLSIQSLTASNPKCYGNTNGTISILAGGGLSPYQYRLNGGSFGSSGSFSSLSPGAYTLQIKDANDCTKDTSVTLINPDSIIASATSRPALCNAINSGSVTIYASGGTGPLSYAMGATGTFGSSNVFNSLSAGTYTFRVRDTNNCIKTITKTVTDSIVLVAASITTTNVSCFSGNNGSISVSPSNGFLPYTYALGTGTFGTSSTFSSLTAGTYAIHVKDSLGCALDTSAIITQPTKLNIGVTKNNPTCYGASSGSITANGSGGKTPYTYSINSGTFTSSPTFSSLVAGTYTVTVKDSNACTKDTSITLTQPTPIQITAFSLTIPKCVGSADGTASIGANGGTGSLKYKIDAGAYSATSTFTGLLAGSHTISIRDSNNCTKDTTFNLINPNPLVIQSFSKTNPLCYGSADGTTTIVASGGASAFEYRIDGGAFSASGAFSGLTAGTHTIRIKDGNDCTKDTTYNLVNPDSISASATARPAFCNAINSGSVTVIASGGVGILSYAMGATGTFGSSNVFNSLAAGTYVFRIRDTNNCIKTITKAVTDSIVLVAASININHVSCFNGNNGSISITPSNGFVPYTFALDAGAFGSSPTFSSLTANSYTIHVKDSLGCFLDSLLRVTQPTKLNIGVTANNPTCYGASSGSITANGSGGKTPYTYSINSGAFTSSPTFSSLVAGTYTVTVKDSNACTKDTSITLTQPTPIQITAFSLTIPKCVGSADGTASIGANGGTGSLKYKIDAGAYSATSTFTGLLAGSHTISIRDSNNCTKDTTFNLINPNPLVIQSFSKTNPLCYGSADGTTTIVASGGASAFEYRIDGGAFSASGAFSGLTAGTHTIRIKDGNDCTKDTTYNLVNPDSLTLTAFVRKNLCNTTANGLVRLKATGGSGGYTYEKNGSGIFVTSYFFDSLAVGTYTFKVKDAKNCIKTISVDIVDSIKVSTTIDVTDVSCFMGDDGIILLTPLVGKSPFAFAIGSGAFGSSPSLRSLSAGTYSLHIKDAFGCTLDTSATVSEPTKLELTLVQTPPTCNGYADGSINAIGSGGTPPYTYSIDAKPFSSSPVFSSLSSKSYIVTIKDAKGCTVIDTVELQQPKVIHFTTTSQMPICYGEENGSITVNASGGTPGYTFGYNSMPPQIANVITMLKAGNYTITVTDKNGCKKDSMVVLSQPEKLNFAQTVIKKPTCEAYADGTITVLGGGGITPYKYAIGSANYQFIDSFTKLLEGSYTLHIRDSNNCQFDTSVKLMGYPKIILDSIHKFITKCYGTSDGGIDLYASGGNPPLRYTLENTIDTIKIASYKNLRSKTYIITVIDTTKCFKSFPAFVPQPDKLQLSTSVINNDCTGLNTNGRITAIVKGGTQPYEYRWSLNNSTDSILSNLENGVYILRIKDANNCIDSLSSEIIYDNCCTPAIPNAFTPNNDGKNDVFRIIYKGDIVLKELSIYNRYGQQVFTTNDINQAWDGRFNNQEAELGVYYYMVKMICGNLLNKEVFLKGDVTLIR